MRILIYGINFSPELVGVGKYTGEMAEWLAMRGHEVRAVTAPPFNPEWKVFPDYSTRRYSIERCFYACSKASHKLELVNAGCSREVTRCPTIKNGDSLKQTKSEFHRVEHRQTSRNNNSGELTVFRCPIWIPQKPRGVSRIIHLVSFALSSCFVMIGQIHWRPDVVIVVEPTFFCLLPAWLTGRIAKAITWLHIQDFELDAAFELGMIRSDGFRRLVAFVENKSMLGFDRVSTISQRMLDRLPQKSVPSGRCILFPNWVDTDEIFPLREMHSLRDELGVPRGSVIALYSGSMGNKQGLEILVEAARRLESRERLRFLICGEGPAKERIAALTKYSKNVLMFPLQPAQRLNELLNMADIHLLPQRADAADLVLPSKLTGMLASGRPVVATALPGTQLAQTVAGRGLIVPPGDSSALAAAVACLADNSSIRQKLGREARAYAVSNLSKEEILSRFERDLLDSTSKRI